MSSSCKPLVFYGACCGIIIALSTIAGFMKSAQLGIGRLIQGIIYLTLLLCIVNYYCKQSEQSGWKAGALFMICCACIPLLVIAMFFPAFFAMVSK